MTWLEMLKEVTEGREIGVGVIKDEDQAMNPFSFDGMYKNFKHQPRTQTKYLRETKQIQIARIHSVELKKYQNGEI
jgi:hypothetical protein